MYVDRVWGRERRLMEWYASVRAPPCDSGGMQAMEGIAESLKKTAGTLDPRGRRTRFRPGARFDAK
jgi:hypothetical protein